MIFIITAVFPPEPLISAQISVNLAMDLSVNSRVTVICPRPTRPNGMTIKGHKDKIGSFEVITVRNYCHPGPSFIGRMLESISFGCTTRKVIRKGYSEISVVYANTWPLFAQYIVTSTCIRLKIPIVLHIQDIYPETLTGKLGLIGSMVKVLLMPLEKYVMRNATSIVAIGKKMAEYIAYSRGIDKSKITVVYNWQDEGRFKEPEHRQNAETGFTLMYLGSLSPSANIEAVIDAFGNSGLNDSKLVIAGSGNSKQSCLNTSSLYPNANIRFVDAPSDKVPELLTSSDVLILPLKKGAGKYSIPSKLAGYMLSSRPVLAFIDPDCDAADIISCSGCGWIVPAGNVQMLTDKMKEVQSIPAEKLLSLGKAGRDYALKHLSKSANLQKLVDIIKNSAIK